MRPPHLTRTIRSQTCCLGAYDLCNTYSLLSAIFHPRLEDAGLYKAAPLLIPKEAGHNGAKLIVLFGTSSLYRSWPAEQATTRGDLVWLGLESWDGRPHDCGVAIMHVVIYPFCGEDVEELCWNGHVDRAESRVQIFVALTRYSRAGVKVPRYKRPSVS